MHFPKIVCQAIDGIRLLKDFVHAERIIGRYFEAAVRQVTLRHGEPQSETNRQCRHFDTVSERRTVSAGMDTLRLNLLATQKIGYSESEKCESLLVK